MNIKALMSEYNIEINDIRWYLSNNLAFTLKEMSGNLTELSQYIESGKLEEELYNIEERYINELQSLADRNQLDEVDVRETFNNVVMLKKNRY